MKSLPVSGGEVLLSKLLVNLTVSVPTALIIGIGSALTLSLDAVDMLSVLAMGLSYALCSAALGLMINLKSHSFDWTSEAVVIKQSASAGIAVLGGMVLVAAPIVLTVLYTDYAALIYYLTTVLMAAVGIALTVFFIRQGDRLIDAL